MRIARKGALRLVRRTKAGHVVEVHLPEEIPAAAEINFLRLLRENDLEEVDFFQNAELREAIHAREGGPCFFCLRRVTTEGRCLDQVVPQLQRGRNSCRNLVSSRLECNLQKGERSAADFLRWLFREGEIDHRGTEVPAPRAGGTGSRETEARDCDGLREFSRRDSEAIRGEFKV